MKKSFFAGIFTGYILIAFLLTLLILLFSFSIIKTFYIDTLTDELSLLADTLEISIKPLYVEKNFQQMGSFVKEIGSKTKTRITVISPEGIVYADSEKNPSLMGNHRTRDEIITALEGGKGKSLRFSSTLKQEMLYVAVPLKEGGSIIGVLRVSLYLENIDSFLNTLKIRIVETALVIFIISFIASLFLARSFLKPVKEIMSASSRLSEGDFDARVIIRGNNELNRLSGNFNVMAEQIKKLFSELEGKKDELNGIISSLREGLIVIDKEDRIILNNESMETILNGDALMGKYFWEAIRNPIFKRIVDDARSKKENCGGEIQIKGTDFFLSASPVALGESIAVVFHNISEIKNIEKIKKDFVANVSHELRTPLTAIKGFAETLEDEVRDEAKEYIEIIKNHTERLINIVNDLLVIGELDEKNAELNYEKVNINHIINPVLKLFGQKAGEKGIDIKVSLSEDISPINADSFRIEQMLINLIDNAVKYTEKGSITISSESAGGSVIIKIQDSGIGIPANDLPRIFERFYAADKSHSRKLGGTGLGLSIVKHIVLVHNGTIEVKSIPDSGTTFIISLPATP